MSQCSHDIANDLLTYGIACVDKLVERYEVFVDHATDVSRLKQDAHNHTGGDTVVIFNATVLTMETAHPNPIEEGVIVIKGGLIQSVGRLSDTVVPPDATIIDAQGGKL